MGVACFEYLSSFEVVVEVVISSYQLPYAVARRDRRTARHHLGTSGLQQTDITKYSRSDNLLT